MKTSIFVWSVISIAVTTFPACGSGPVTSKQENDSITSAFNSQSAYLSGNYRNLFVEYGLASEAEVSARVASTYKQLFFGDKNSETVMYVVEDDMAYIYEVVEDDIRSESMSYGMMISVMMDDQDTFNKLWRFTKKYMQVHEGEAKGYFSWQLQNEAPYTAIDPNPAPDGEEYIAMALFFADKRWGSQQGVLNYSAEANAILDVMVNKRSPNVGPLMHPLHKQIVFTPMMLSEEQFTDPSYHLPAFYELWALWAETNNEYWREVAEISRDLLVKASHPETGLFPEYASFEGAPQETSFNADSHNSSFDSHRVIQNLAMDYMYISRDKRMLGLIERMLVFLNNEGEQPRNYFSVYTMEGKPLVDYKTVSSIAMNAVGAAALNEDYAKGFIEELWKQTTPTGKYRYYDGMLLMFGMLHVSGNFKIYGSPGLAN